MFQITSPYKVLVVSLNGVFYGRLTTLDPKSRIHLAFT